MKTRTEQDKIGCLTLPADVLYGIHTARAIDNFALEGQPVRLELIHAMVQVKKAAALTNRQLHQLEPEKADAIVSACDAILTGQYDSAFPTAALQGGAGTSTNMNVNEVVANVALLQSGHAPGDYRFLSPLDDVNRSQSTNDVYPTALRVAAILLIRSLSDQLSALQESLQRREQEFEEVRKLGRTQLMDALPVTLGQEFGAYAQAIARDRWRIYKTEERLRQVNLGGTAVGTGAGADRRYPYKVVEHLRELTGIGLALSEYPMDFTQNQDVFVEVSGLLKSCAVNLMKIANDLRLMNSGPKGGLGEITLEQRQAGSTIMPGKVNPVIPEMVTQAAIRVMANDTAIATAAASGQLELNAFLPLIADSLLDSLCLLRDAVRLFRTKCIDTLTANPDACRRHLMGAAVLETALVPYIGYDRAALIAKEAKGDAVMIRRLVLKQGLLEEEVLDRVLAEGRISSYERK